MKLLMFAASLSKKSVNKSLINLSARLVREQGHQIDLADFSEFDVPSYNADVQAGAGIPKAVTEFVKRMHDSDGLIISVPEYNFSMPGHLKNLVDWVSRINPMPWRDQYIQLMSASPSLVGGNRGLWATRIPLEACGAFVCPDMFSLASAHEAFDEQGNLVNKQLQERLNAMLGGYLGLIVKLKG